MKIIDTHAHIFPQKIADKASKSIGEFYDLPIFGVGKIEDLIASGEKIGVSKYFVHSTATTPKQVESINQFILTSVEQNKLFEGLITLHPDQTEVEIEKNIHFAIANKLKGIKLHPDFQQFSFDEARAEKIFEQTSGKLPILTHAGDKRMNYSSPLQIAKVAKKYKNLTIIAAHFGGYTEWEKVSCYDGLDNIYFDTCSTLHFLPKADCKRIIEHFSADRFLFGSDFPMWEHTKELERLKNLELSQTEYEKILHKNAELLYNL